MENRKLYTKIYPFMYSELRLKGVAKEVFAVIFGFWVNNSAGAPVKAPLNIIHSITGACRRGIVKSIKRLEEQGFLEVFRSKGECNLYKVTINEEILKKFKTVYCNQDVAGGNQQLYTRGTSSGSTRAPQTQNYDYKITKINSLRVRPKENINTGNMNLL